MGITFREIGDDCSLCPLYKADICHGLANYGGGPVYPPCSEMDENTDADEYLEKLREAERHRAEARKAKAQSEAEKAHKKELQKKRRRISDAYCRKELEIIKTLEKMLKHWEDAGESRAFDLTFAEAMEKGGIPFGDTEQIKNDINLAEERTRQIEAALADAKKQLAIKRAEVQKTAEYKTVK